MAVKYDFFKVPELITKGKERYSARSVISGEMDLEQIADIVASRSTVKQSDVLAAWKGMLQVIKEGLADGKRVHLNGLCYMNLSAQSDFVRSTKEIRAESIRCRDIVYRTEKDVKRSLAVVKFERGNIRHSSDVSDIEIDSMLRDYFKYNTYITRKEFARICKLSPSTAIRKMNILVSEGKLDRPAKRAGFYFPVPGVYVSAHGAAAQE